MADWEIVFVPSALGQHEVAVDAVEARAGRLLGQHGIEPLMQKFFLRGLQVAELVNADPREIFFTSCGTEGNNTAIHSAVTANPEKRARGFRQRTAEWPDGLQSGRQWCRGS